MYSEDYPEAVGSSTPAVEFLSESVLWEEQANWDDQDKNLYLCVGDYYGRRGKVLYVVYRINLKALLFSEDLEFETVFEVPDNDNIGNCAGFGMGLSMIFLGGGFKAKYSKEFVVPEPCTGILAYQIREIFEGGHLAHFLDGKVRPLIWEVEGNLFALARNPPPRVDTGIPASEWRNCFEMYDRAQGRWIGLPDPPSYAEYPVAAVDESGGGGIDEEEEFVGCDNSALRRHCYYSSFSYAILGSQLFVSNPNYHEYSYKCNLPSKGENWPVEWKVSSFQFQGVTLGVQTAQGFVVFSYDVNCRPPEYVLKLEDNPYLNIKVQLLINGYDEPVLSQSLMMPQQLDEVQDSQFVHLGGQKVCFLYSRMRDSKLLVTAITFGFQLEQRNSGFKVKAKFYPTRNWEFQNKAGSKAKVWGTEQMVGAVVG
ncbi:uncharacterized protein LOC112165854 [Rosa chinensis]|uniref:uncharacterized protein LOC112165854 n=1 Tax=Rosa chinensis TaxID=74649 RepID=UPI000D08E042|nr:uncharacterized protein LOC112165854 [Rosa chinensis]